MCIAVVGHRRYLTISRRVLEHCHSKALIIFYFFTPRNVMLTALAEDEQFHVYILLWHFSISSHYFHPMELYFSAVVVKSLSFHPRHYFLRWPTTAIHKYLLYYCILYLSTQTYSLAARVYLPVQWNIHQYNNTVSQYRNVNFSTKI